MRIAPITTNYITRNNNVKNNVKFSGLYDDSDEKFERTKSEVNSAAMLVGLTVLATMGIGGALLLDNKKANNEEFCEKVEDIYHANNIQKDTFTIKDMTDDNKPDLILYKNDGSIVVIDIANQQVLEKNDDLTPVE